VVTPKTPFSGQAPNPVDTGPASGNDARMSSPPAIGNGSRLSFMAPLSEERATRLVASFKPATILDYGCGWAELMLRIVAATPAATATGVDIHAPDRARARTNAAARNLTDRVSFVETSTAHADLVISIGAYQAFGTVPEALTELRSRVNPGGTLLFGAEFWEQPPTPDRLAHMWPDASPDDCTDLPTLVDHSIAAGFRPVQIQTATPTEWEDFESGLAADLELWLASNPTHPEAPTIRERLDAQRNIWLRGHRGVLGFAYLTLAAC
jgi:SAM-dependent methyltransferase